MKKLLNIHKQLIRLTDSSNIKTMVLFDHQKILILSMRYY